MATTDSVDPTQNNGVTMADEKKGAGLTPTDSSSALESGTHEVPLVDPAEEQAIFRKLDYRIVPTVMWCYLMNMMDRGTTHSRAEAMAMTVSSSFGIFAA